MVRGPVSAGAGVTARTSDTRIARSIGDCSTGVADDSAPTAAASGAALNSRAVHAGSTDEHSGSASTPTTARVQIMWRVAADDRRLRSLVAPAAAMSTIDTLTRRSARVIACLREPA
jgi:hypothetical protein